MEIDYKQIEINYNKGFSDIKNAKLVGCSKGTIRNWRNKNSLSPNFLPTKEKALNKEEFLKLYKKGLTDLKIAVILNSSEKAVNSLRNRLKLKSNRSHDIEITKEMEEVLVGTILGDSYIRCVANSREKKLSTTGQLIFGHSTKQSEFVFWKWKNLIDLFNKKPKYVRQKRKNKTNYSFYCYSVSSISLKKYHKLFYKDWVKIIPEDIYKYLTPLGLATLFMDDGYEGPYICLNNFDDVSLLNFQNALYKNWKIDSSITKRKEVYIPARSRKIFEDLIKPYIIPTMTYKLSL